MNTNPVVTQFTGDAKPFLAEIAKIKGQLTGFRRDVSNISSQVGNLVKGYLGFRAISGTIRSIVDATAEAQAAQAQLNSALAAAGAPVKAASAEFQAYATQLQKVTTFGDEAITQVESILLSFKGLSGGVVKDATASVLDLSTRMGIDAASAAKLLGKALADPIGGLGTLSRSGVIFTEQQKEQIKTLVESGKELEAQTYILDELGKSFGGAATAARDTFGGAITGLKNAFGDLLEGGDGINAASDAINGLTDVLSSPEIKQAFTDLISGLATVIRLATETAGGLAIIFRGGDGPDEQVNIDNQMRRLTEERKAIERDLAIGGRRDDMSPGGIEIYSEAQQAADRKRIQDIDAELRALQSRFEIEGERKRQESVYGKELKFGIQANKSDPLAFTTGGETDGQSEAARKAAEEAADALRHEHIALLIEHSKLIDELEQMGIDAGEELTKQGLDQAMRAIDDNYHVMQEDADRRVQLERETQEAILSARQGATNAAIGLLQVLSQRSKTAAKALIILNRGLSIAQAVQNTAVAVTKTLASLPYPANLAAAAHVKALGAIEVGIIAATGIAELSSAGGGNFSPVAPGTPNNPIYTQSGDDAQRGVSGQPAVNITVNGYISQSVIDDMLDQMGEFFNNRDGVVINRNSRQALELRG